MKNIFSRSQNVTRFLMQFESNDKIQNSNRFFDAKNAVDNLLKVEDPSGISHYLQQYNNTELDKISNELNLREQSNGEKIEDLEYYRDTITAINNFRTKDNNNNESVVFGEAKEIKMEQENNEDTDKIENKPKINQEITKPKEGGSALEIPPSDGNKNDNFSSARSSEKSSPASKGNFWDKLGAKIQAMLSGKGGSLNFGSSSASEKKEKEEKPEEKKDENEKTEKKVNKTETKSLEEKEPFSKFEEKKQKLVDDIDHYNETHSVDIQINGLEDITENTPQSDQIIENITELFRLRKEGVGNDKFLASTAFLHNLKPKVLSLLLQNKDSFILKQEGKFGDMDNPLSYYLYDPTGQTKIEWTDEGIENFLKKETKNEAHNSEIDKAKNKTNNQWIRNFCKNSTNSEALAIMLNRIKDEEVDKSHIYPIILNPYTNFSDIKDLINSDDELIRKGIALRMELSNEEMEILANDPINLVRATLALNPNVLKKENKNILEKLENDPIPEIKTALDMNKKENENNEKMECKDGVCKMPEENTEKEVPTEKNEMIKISEKLYKNPSEKQLQEIVKNAGEKTVILKMGSPSCKPCREFDERLENQYLTDPRSNSHIFVTVNINTPEGRKIFQSYKDGPNIPALAAFQGQKLTRKGTLLMFQKEIDGATHYEDIFEWASQKDLKLSLSEEEKTPKNLSEEMKKDPEIRNYDFIVDELIKDMPKEMKEIKDPLEKMNAQIFWIVNAYRKNLGKLPVKSNDEIAKLSQEHSKYMTDHGLSHENASERAQKLRKTIGADMGQYFGENVSNAGTAQRAMKGWLKSPRHRENIEGDYTHLGMGFAPGKNGERVYSTQIFWKNSNLYAQN